MGGDYYIQGNKGIVTAYAGPIYEVTGGPINTSPFEVAGMIAERGI